MTSFLSLLTIFACQISVSFAVMDSSSTTSVPVGQNPAIAYTPNSGQGDLLVIFNSAQGLEAVFCPWGDCGGKTSQTILCNAKIYQSAIIAVNSSDTGFAECAKSVPVSSNGHGTAYTTYHCTYFIVVGYGSLTQSSMSSVSFITCYDASCSPHLIEETVIDTSFGGDTSTSSSLFGYGISLTTWTRLNDGPYSQRLPLFTYTQYSSEYKQFLINAIICADVTCLTWVGKDQSQFASTPPFVAIGPHQATVSVGKPEVSVQEIWIGDVNFVSIAYPNFVNISNNVTKTHVTNVFVLAMATCALNADESALYCRRFVGKLMNATVVFRNDTQQESKQVLKTNHVSMQRYDPRVKQPHDSNIPLSITAYVINAEVNSQTLNQLWLLYCFDLFCSKNTRMAYSVHAAAQIDSPKLTLPQTAHGQALPQYLPKIVYFENASAVFVFECNQTWNCTESAAQHQRVPLYSDANFQTSSMQIATQTNVLYQQETTIVFSQVMSKDVESSRDVQTGGAGVFNGTMIMQCLYLDCAHARVGPRLLAHSNTIKVGAFESEWSHPVFIVAAWLITFIVGAGVFVMYRLVNPKPFIARNVQNSYLNQVALDSSRIHPLSQWFFFATFLCCAMCIVPWFAYFSSSDLRLYASMIIPPFIPILLTLGLVFILRVCSLQTKRISPVLLVMSLLYYGASLAMAYSFSFVYNVQTTDCTLADLSGLKMVVEIGHIFVVLVLLYLIFWNIRCFQALKIASPQKSVMRHPSSFFHNKRQKRRITKHVAQTKKLLDALPYKQITD